MNCLDYRRLKLADPRRLPPQAHAHEQGCESCAAFAREVEAGELELQRALATPVPDGLAERIVLRTGGRAVRRAPLWALAASVVLALGLGLGYLRFKESGGDAYARLAIEHVVMEPESLTTLRNAEPEAFRRAVESFGATLRQPLERVRYVRLCPFDDGMGWHIVFETPDGLATLILVSDRRLSSEQSASTTSWSAIVRPGPRGYYAVVASTPEAAAHAENVLQQHVDWRAASAPPPAHVGAVYSRLTVAELSP